MSFIIARAHAKQCSLQCSSSSSVCPSVCVKTAKHIVVILPRPGLVRETRFLRIKRRYKVRRVTVSEAGYKKFTILSQLVAVTTSRQTRLTVS